MTKKEKLEELQKIQEGLFNEKAKYHMQALLTDDIEKKKEFKKKEEEVFAKACEVNSEIRNMITTK